jgi:hypothetical protein
MKRPLEPNPSAYDRWVDRWPILGEMAFPIYHTAWLNGFAESQESIPTQFRQNERDLALALRLLAQAIAKLQSIGANSQADSLLAEAKELGIEIQIIQPENLPNRQELERRAEALGMTPGEYLSKLIKNQLDQPEPK